MGMEALDLEFSRDDLSLLDQDSRSRLRHLERRRTLSKPEARWLRRELNTNPYILRPAGSGDFVMGDLHDMLARRADVVLLVLNEPLLGITGYALASTTNRIPLPDENLVADVHAKTLAHPKGQASMPLLEDSDSVLLSFGVRPNFRGEKRASVLLVGIKAAVRTIRPEAKRLIGFVSGHAPSRSEADQRSDWDRGLYQLLNKHGMTSEVGTSTIGRGYYVQAGRLSRSRLVTCADGGQ